MSYCQKCGAQLKDDAKFCSECGEPVRRENTYSYVQPESHEYSYGKPDENNQYNYAQSYNENMDKPKDSGSWGWGVLGFFFPIVGLILLLVWSKDKPKSAKAAGIGALISAIIGIVSFFVRLIFGAILMSDMIGAEQQIIDGFETISVMLMNVL